MATFTIDQIAITRTSANIDDDDVFELQIKDGGVDDEKSAKIKKSELAKALNGGFLIFEAFLTQSSTNAPILDDIDGGGSGAAFIDTLGGVLSYNAVGSYYYTKTGAFTDATKIFVELGNNVRNQGSDVAISVVRVNANVLEIRSDVLSQFASPAAATPTNGKMYVQPIRIKVKQ
jgi:hypothetical protein